MSKRFKKVKKEDQILVDEKTGQLYIGNKDLRLLMLRPIELIEFTEFAGTNAEDIITWVGKTIAKYFVEKLFPGENVAKEDMSTKKEIILYVLETFEGLGYGVLSSQFKQKEIFIFVQDSISSEEKDNIMAKNICMLFLGIFKGIMEQLEIDTDAQEISCVLLGYEACTYKFNLLTGEFGENDIDKDEKATQISRFLKTL
jgi:predicted hydrocarbon binding protein